MLLVCPNDHIILIWKALKTSNCGVALGQAGTTIAKQVANVVLEDVLLSFDERFNTNRIS